MAMSREAPPLEGEPKYRIYEERDRNGFGVERLRYAVRYYSKRDDCWNLLSHHGTLREAREARAEKLASEWERVSSEFVPDDVADAVT